MIKEWIEQWKNRRLNQQIVNIDLEILQRQLRLGRYYNVSDHTNDICLRALNKRLEQLIQKHKNNNVK